MRGILEENIELGFLFGRLADVAWRPFIGCRKNIGNTVPGNINEITFLINLNRQDT